jgi:5-methylcytosine-specific restriction endonuclease McrA
MTTAHEQTDTIREEVLYPEHVQRTESEEFRRNKLRLVRKLDLGCWVCGSRDKREVHHIHEWSLAPSLDMSKALDTLHCFDPYGFTAHDPETPLSGPDDLRNLLVLCETCHRGADAGVHRLTYPIWVARRAAKPGVQITVLPG